MSTDHDLCDTDFGLGAVEAAEDADAAAPAAEETATTKGAVEYRPMRWEDVDGVADVFNRVWPQGERLNGTAAAHLIAEYLTLHYLEPSTWSNVAVLPDGTIAGITLAKVDGNDPLFKDTAAALEEARTELHHDSRGSDALDMLEDGFFVREGILEEDSDIHETTQAELELFMVNPAVKGQGVGGHLWRDLLAAFREQGVEAFFLHTDSSCDFGFYDHKGLDCVAQRLHADHPEDGDTEPDLIGDDQYIYRGVVSQLK
ncbi:MAG: GNAT family N-acetyltransferase [Bifidobacterium sp.]|nr:GNAT family N-acetyltransferase [Bifidobacterium sp.]